MKSVLSESHSSVILLQDTWHAGIGFWKFFNFGRRQLNKETAVLVNLGLSRLQPCLWHPSSLSPGILYTNKLQGLNFLHFIHCPWHGYPCHDYCYCFHLLLSLPKPLFFFLPLIFLLLWDAYCLSYFSPAVLNWPLRKAMPSIITYHCWFSLTERSDCCRGCPGLDDRWLDVCYGCSLQIHEQQKFPPLMSFLFFLECALRIRNSKLLAVAE